MSNAADYPLPGYAAYVWYDGQSLLLQLPAQVGEDGHIIRLPLHKASWGVLLEILSARHKSDSALRTARAIGRKASPVQYDVEKMLKQLGRATFRSDGAAVERAKSLDELDLDGALEDMQRQRAKT